MSSATYNVYDVTSPGGFTRRIVAKDSAAAKREYCRRIGRKPPELTAKVVKEHD